ncbi:YphA family membrane protein [Bacillus taeanensis]|uniref:Uncharacterized protein n=1 Tax=Bacillus taeanensis TaxID=273032 RepID=A0A366XWL9_9BACI|nr:hypothetical protein [Bacillus taeanensis]RBW70297.1 hypothetical protein DS031_06920 [Bacillus taeanensis]
MEGIYFYWFSWIYWIWLTFLMSKEKRRFPITVGLLLLLIFSNCFIHLSGMDIALSLLGVFIIGIIVLTYLSTVQKWYSIIISLITTFIYVSILVMSVYDPVWMIIPVRWFAPFAIFSLLLLIGKDIRIKISSLLIGFAAGELIFGLLLTYHHLYNVVGGLGFLDRLSICFMSTMIWYGMEKGIARVDALFQRKKYERNGSL